MIRRILGNISIAGILLLGSAACEDGDPSSTTPTMTAPAVTAPAVTAPAATAPAATAPAATAPAANMVKSTLGRLLVADGNPTNPEILIVDLDDGKVTARHMGLTNARAYSTSVSAPYGYANQRTADIVDVFDSGIRGHLSMMGMEYAKNKASMMAFQIKGPMPTHWVAHDGWVVSFNDGDGSVDYLYEASLEGPRPVMRRVATGRAHHGVSVISHGALFASLPDPVDQKASLPVGVTMRLISDPEKIVKMSADCTGLHGEAANEKVVAFGCADGVLLAERNGDDWAFRKLPNPAGAPMGRRVGTVRAIEGLSQLLGNWGNGFVVIDPAAGTWKDVDVGGSNLGFFLMADKSALVVLSGDGSLRKYDPKTGAPIGVPLMVMDAHMPPMGTTAINPAFTLGLSRAYVADPRKGAVVEVDLAAWKVERTLAVGGKPWSLAVFGMGVAMGK